MNAGRGLNWRGPSLWVHAVPCFLWQAMLSIMHELALPPWFILVKANAKHYSHSATANLDVIFDHDRARNLHAVLS